MTTMLERVARAIYHCTPRNKPWDSLAAPHKAHWLKRGRAAIEAMREADDAMLIAGVRIVRAEGEVSDPLAGMVYRSMIDAALSEGPHDAG